MPIRWCALHEALDGLGLPENYRFVQLNTSGIDLLVNLLGDWFPEISTSSEACHLQVSFFEERAFLADRPDSQDRFLFPLLMTFRGRPVSYFSLQIEPNSRTITGRLLVIDPRHRGKGLGGLAPEVVERFGRKMGAELVYYYVSLNTVHQQVIAEAAGYDLVGIIPASDRHLMPSGDAKRIYEGIYAKVLVSEEACLTPPHQAMTPKTERLFRFLFKAGLTKPRLREINK